MSPDTAPKPTYDELAGIVAELRALVVRLEKRVGVLEQENGRLHSALEEARRAGKRQAGPFSKGEPKADPKPPGRKSGEAHGPSAFRAIPEVIDEVHDAPLPARCPDCDVDLIEVRVAPQYQTEIPKVRPIVRRFDVHVGFCPCCRTRVQGRHPLQTSDALGSAASQLGPQALALASHLHTELGTPFGRVRTFFQTFFGLVVSCGGLARGLGRLARKLEPTYDGLLAEVRTSPIVYPDETSMRVSGRLGWLWVFVTPQATVYVQRLSRGLDVIDEVLGADYDGVAVHDGWSPYDRLALALHQQCLAHLLRRARGLIEVATGMAARFPKQVKALLQDALALRDRRDAGEVSPHGVLVATGQLESRLTDVLATHTTDPANERFRKHLAGHRDDLFTFLRLPNVEATSWPADHATRPAVLFRKVSGGHRSLKGAHAHEVLASVARTCWQRAADGFVLAVRALCMPDLKALAIRPALPGP